MLFKVVHNAPLQASVPTSLHMSWRVIHAGPRIVHQTGQVELAVWYERPVTVDGELIEPEDDAWQHLALAGTGEVIPFGAEHVMSFYTPPYAWHVYRLPEGMVT